MIVSNSKGSATEKNPMMWESRVISGCSHMAAIEQGMSAIISESGISDVLRSMTARASSIIVTTYTRIAEREKPKNQKPAAANNPLVTAE